MKKVWIVIIGVILSLPVYPESPVNIGLKFGVNSSKLITNFDDILNQNIQENKINNYFAGAFARVSIGRLYLQPEAYFNTKGGAFNTPDNVQGAEESINQIDFQTVDIPVMIGIKIINKPALNLRINVGPLFSFVTSKSLGSTISGLTYDDLNNHYMGWQAGIGVDFWFLTVDARFENSANVFSNSNQFSGYNKVFLLSAGIKLF